MGNEESCGIVNLLIVDDEPGIVESIYALCLKHFSGEDVFVIRAYSSEEVIRIMQSTCVDILLSDIRMPRISGLNLAGWVEKFNPLCKVIFLTGYRSFDYAQEAVQNQCVVDYLLKSSTDEVLLATLDKHVSACVQRQRRGVNPDELFATSLPAVERVRLDTLQHGGPVPRGLTAEKPVWLLRIHCAALHHAPVVAHFEDLMSKLLEEAMPFFTCRHVALVSARDFLFCLQLREDDPISDLNAYLRSRLEMVRIRISPIQSPITFVYTEKGYAMAELPDHIQAMDRIVAGIRGGGEGLLIGEEALMAQSGAIRGAEEPSELIRRIYRIIDDHLSNPNFSLDLIAEKTFYSASYISRIFRRQTGRKIIDYINETRLQKSKVCLRGGMRMSDVAHEVGFKSVSYFSAFFKKATGVTPGDYQRGSQETP